MRFKKFELITEADFISSVSLNCRSSIQPIHCLQQLTKPWIFYGERGQPFADWFAFPPCFLANRRELITIKSRADVMRRRVGKRIVRQERECAAIVVQKSPDKM